MDYLHEIARVILPGVRRAALAPMHSLVLRALADRCEELIEAREEVLRTERQAASRPALVRSKVGGTGAQLDPATPPSEAATVTPGEGSTDTLHKTGATPPERPDSPSIEVPDAWLKASHTRAVEFLADALAESPDQIPLAIHAAAPEGFYPTFLKYLVDTVVEAAQPRYRPRTLVDRLWWWIWTWFAASEYAAQLRDRHEQVARELARTRSWKKLDRQTRAQDQPPAGDTVKKAARRVMDSVRTAVAPKRTSNSWQRLIATLPDDGPQRQFKDALSEELLVRPHLVQRLARVSGAAVPFDLAFDVELREIRKSRMKRNGNEQPRAGARSTPRAAADLNLFGVALSGGGIRSATFNLGVLQGLAGNQLLRDVDYLSTVSGGGYVGAWLAAWIKKAGRRESGSGVQVVEDRLRAEPIGAPDDDEVRAVRFLREYSNYLTPRTGFFSADTWTMLAIWFRNTLLNQTVLVLALAGALMTPWAIWFTLTTLVGHPETRDCVGLRATAPVLTTIATTLIVLASAVAGQQLRRFNLPPERRATVAGEMLRQGGVLTAIVLPVTIAAWLLSVVLCSALPHFTEPAFRRQAWRELFVIFVLGLAIVAIGGRYWRCFLADRIASKATAVSKRAAVWAAVVISLGLGLSSAIGAAMIVGLGTLVASLRVPGDQPPLTLHMVAWTLPVLVGVMSIMVVLKIGILGRNLFDEHREWWSRLGAWLNIVALAWLTLFAVSLYSPYLVTIGNKALRNLIVTSGGIGWAAWTAAGVLLGKSGQKVNVGAVLKSGRIRTTILALAPYVFIAGLLVIVATAAVWLIIGILPTEASPVLDQTHWTAYGKRWHWVVLGPAGLIGLAFLLSCRVDVNDFSMHHFYKNRLVRCYLGAPRDERSDPARRSPDPFTGFDAADDLSLADLQLYCGRGDPALRTAKMQRNPHDLDPYVGPIPIVNTALNLVTGDDLAWQERKAQSFAFTPFYSGYDYYARADKPHDRFAPYGFRPTVLYGYPPFGVGLGTAVAISGAAASPNMGYHTAPAASFLMTMFNARLGWWMGNPRDKYNWLRSGPRRGLLYLLNDLFGLTNDQTHFVNLSDGGHFENLGIYELVRRRCRYVIACDAEQDDALTFSGLGNAIRKCRMDLGVEITVRASRIQPPAGALHSALHCVVGDIRYPNGELGTLLYLKASLTGDEPADVLEYKAQHPAFPHHSTLLDQFFDESQFESYRKLGVHVAQVAFAVPDMQSASLADRFAFLRDYWYPSSTGADRSGHAAQYGVLLDRIRAAQSLAFIDPAFFDRKGPEKGLDRVERQELFVGASLLDLMQRVFLELDLENDRDHPHNAGWMEIFGKWMRQEAVQKAWNASAANYGRPFQRFVNQLLAKNAAPVAVRPAPASEESSRDPSA